MVETVGRHGPSGDDGWEDGVVPEHGGNGRAAWTQVAVMAGWHGPRWQL
jgi:hypothetical protein